MPFRFESCRTDIVGLESGNQHKLADYHKKATVDDNTAAARLLKETMAPLTSCQALPMLRIYKDRLIIEKVVYEDWNVANASIGPSQMILRQYYWQLPATACISTST